ncbi:MAG: hypothetical protein ACP5NK_04945 [Thermoplasmata archaeon]
MVDRCMKGVAWRIARYLVVITSLVAYFFFLFRDNLVYIEPGVVDLSFLLILLFLLLSLSLISGNLGFPSVRRYLMLSFMFIIILLILVTPNPVFKAPDTYAAALRVVVLIFTNLLFLPFLVIALLFSLLIYSDENPGRGNRVALLTFIILGLFMLLVSGILRVNTIGTGRLLIGSIYDDENPAGVPALFAYSLILYSNTFVTTLSIQYMLLILLDLSLIVQNFTFIFSLVSRDRSYVASNAVSSALIAVSCQCEGLIATLPAIASLLVSILIYPLIIEGVLLVLFTNMLLYFYFIRGRRYRPLEKSFFGGILTSRIMTLPMVAPIVILFLGSLAGFQYSIYFIFGVNILMFLSGVIFFWFLSKVMFLNFKLDTARSLSLFITSTVFMFTWFVPSVTESVITNTAVYALMVILTFLSGIVTGILYHGLKDRARGILMESVSMMFSLTGLVMLYSSLELRINPWYMFAGYAVSIFAIILIITSFPVLWLSTNIALNRTVRPD